MPKLPKTSRMCAGCAAVVDASVVVCRPCRTTLMEEVRAAYDDLRQLDVTLSRQDKVTALSVGGKSSETPTPFHVGASNAITALRDATRALGYGVTHSSVAEFRRARHEAQTVIDIPDPHALIGVCDCGRSVYARTGDTTVTCGCGKEWDAAPLDAAREVAELKGTVPTIRGWLQFLGIVRSQAQVYRDVKPLTPASEDPRVYYLADVYTSLLTKEHRRGA